MCLSSGNMAVGGDAVVQEHSAIKSQPNNGEFGSACSLIKAEGI